ncbi:MAG: HIT family protein [Alphaproteobacteria bacterium]|nr:HIT family protein [Alphaproteobacteria bacterium]
MKENFKLHYQLEADSIPLRIFDLCIVRLINEKHWPWLVLVPQRDIKEIDDLSIEDQHKLIGEITKASHWLRTAFYPDKINVGSMGNIVTQFHVHVVARYKNDPLWPMPVWRALPPVRLTQQEIQERIDQLTKVEFL